MIFQLFPKKLISSKTKMAKVPNQNLDHFSASIISRGRGARTPIYGFGDRCSTIELFPYGLGTTCIFSCLIILPHSGDGVNGYFEKFLKLLDKLPQFCGRRNAVTGLKSLICAVSEKQTHCIEKKKYTNQAQIFTKNCMKYL